MLLHDLAALRAQLAEDAAVRARFLGRLHPGPAAIRMLRLLGAIVATPARWRALTLALIVGAVTVTEVLVVLRLAVWNADFFNVLEAKSFASLINQIWILAAIVTGMMVLQGLSLQTKMQLQMVLRSHLTHIVRDSWMSDGRYYRLRMTAGEHDNEDGRIAEDIRVVCEMVVEFLVSLLYAFIQLTLFAGVLWLYSGPLTIAVGGTSFTLPGHMVWVALGYAAIGSAIVTLVGHPLVRATDRRQAAEANYRARLVNVIAHAPAIALTGAEAGERRRLARAFEGIRGAWAVQTASFRNLIFFSSGLALLTTILPLLILAPRYLHGEMSLGTLMQVTIAFGQVTAALSWLAGNYSSIAQWEASAARVLALQEAVEDLGGRAVTGAGLLSREPAEGPLLAFRDLSVVTPTGEVLLEHFSAEIRLGERVLVEATPQAAAALFRAIAGLSISGAGRIELPRDSAPFFMADRSYLPEATLLEVLAEPRPPESFAPEAVARVLVDVGLAQVVPRLGTTALWEQEFGIEDQQRLGFARLLLHRPDWILMHDASSALSPEAEDMLIELIAKALPGSALITITHRAMAGRMFNRRISVSTVGRAP
ncbi:ABC transporter ATP-binding protein/permease [Phreatobacter sp. HK31-P]